MECPKKGFGRGGGGGWRSFDSSWVDFGNLQHLSLLSFWNLFCFLLLLLFVVEKPEALTYSPLIFSENRFEGGKLAEIRLILNTLWVKNICGYRV